MDMKRCLRYHFVAAFFALGAASFGAEMFLFFSYINSQPPKPNPALGFIHAEQSQLLGLSL
jgi:hypothetical protein